MNWQLFSAFLVITVVLFLTPGPIVTLVVATGATRGIRAGLMIVAGSMAGNALLLVFIASGLSWILKTSAEVFDAVRWIGAAYLVWLGIQAWRHAGVPVEASPPSGRVHVWRGFIVALTNPKTIAFFTAFLPQFIDPSLPIERQLMIMCTVSVLMGGVLDSGWAIAAGLGRAWFVKPSRTKLLNRLSAVMLIGGGIWLSLARRPV